MRLFNAKQAGVVVDLWKCVGERRVIAIVQIDSVDTRIKFYLPYPLCKNGATRTDKSDCLTTL
jgi:hypothetical protein